MTIEITDEMRALVYRELADDDAISPTVAHMLTTKADELDPPTPVTIDKVPGWEVVWCSKGAIAIRFHSVGFSFRLQWEEPDGVQVDDTRHPWPERPEPLIPDGWGIMHLGDLVLGPGHKGGRHHLYSTETPGSPWYDLQSAVDAKDLLVVARERKDRDPRDDGDSGVYG